MFPLPPEQLELGRGKSSDWFEEGSPGERGGDDKRTEKSAPFPLLRRGRSSRGQLELFSLP